MAIHSRAKVRRPVVWSDQRQEAFWGLLCISPWLLGFIIFTAGPIIVSIVMSFMRWDIISTPEWVGLKNYVTILTRDQLFAKSLRNTINYTVLAVPVGLVVGLAVGLLLNVPRRGIRIFRTIYYLPAVLPVVSVALLWTWLFNPYAGVINRLLGTIGIQGPKWLADPNWAMPTLILMSLWGVGGGTIIYLAGLKAIPAHLYEAALIDGAGVWARFCYVTLPMLSPTLFFNLITGLIGTFQVFTPVYILAGEHGGAGGVLLFYVLYLYRQAFRSFQMGYACALAWILFLLILGLTLLVFRSSSAWVYYEGELRQ